MEIDNLIIGLQIIKQSQPDAKWYCQDCSLYCGTYNPLDLTEHEQEVMYINGWYEDEEHWCIDGGLPFDV